MDLILGRMNFPFFPIIFQHGVQLQGGKPALVLEMDEYICEVQSLCKVEKSLLIEFKIHAFTDYTCSDFSANYEKDA